MPEVLDEHDDYGAVVRFTKGEWEAVVAALELKEVED